MLQFKKFNFKKHYKFLFCFFPAVFVLILLEFFRLIGFFELRENVYSKVSFDIGFFILMSFLMIFGYLLSLYYIEKLSLKFKFKLKRSFYFGFNVIMYLNFVFLVVIYFLDLLKLVLIIFFVFFYVLANFSASYLILDLDIFQKIKNHFFKLVFFLFLMIFVMNIGNLFLQGMGGTIMGDRYCNKIDSWNYRPILIENYQDNNHSSRLIENLGLRVDDLKSLLFVYRFCEIESKNQLFSLNISELYIIDDLSVKDNKKIYCKAKSIEGLNPKTYYKLSNNFYSDNSSILMCSILEDYVIYNISSEDFSKLNKNFFKTKEGCFVKGEKVSFFEYYFRFIFLNFLIDKDFNIRIG